MVTTAILVGVLAFGGGTGAQDTCSVEREQWGQWGTVGSIRATGQTRLSPAASGVSPCMSWQVRNETWIWLKGPNRNCVEGSFDSSRGSCVQTSTAGGTARAAEGYSGTCGLWDAQHKHWAIHLTDGDQVEYGTTASNTDGGDCAQLECETSGGTWDGSTCDYGSPSDPPDEEPGGGCCTPIVIPLTNVQTFKLTSAADGVVFDFDGNGTVEQTAWTAADSKLGFLAIDRNGNGAIDNGTELFGDATFQGISNGFAALRRYLETMGITPTGTLVAGHPLFDQLLLWEDANHNGISEPSELYPLGRYVARLPLGYELHNRRDGHGNRFRWRSRVEVVVPGHARAKDPGEQQGRLREIYDVVFVTK